MLCGYLRLIYRHHSEIFYRIALLTKKMDKGVHREQYYVTMRYKENPNCAGDYSDRVFVVKA